MTEVFHFAWLTKTGNHTWKVCSTQDLAKRIGQEIRHDLVGYWVTELTLLIRSQFSLRLNCYEMLWLYIDKSRLQGIPQSFYGNYPKNSLSWDFSISIWNMVGFDLLLFILKIETTIRGTNSMPLLVFQRDHLRSTSGIICGSGSFAVQFGDHFRWIICGAGLGQDSPMQTSCSVNKS